MKIIKVSMMFLFCSLVFIPQVEARSNFFISGGYQQNFMFTGDNSLSGGDDGNVDFKGGYGFYVAPGYQAKGRFGFQIPFRASNHRVNGFDKNTWMIGADVAPIMRIFHDPQEGWDPYISAGFGINQLTEGSRQDSSSTFGIDLMVALGVEYHFTDRAAMRVELPYRAIIFGGDRLSSDATLVNSIPITAGVTWNF